MPESARIKVEFQPEIGKTKNLFFPLNKTLLLRERALTQKKKSKEALYASNNVAKLSLKLHSFFSKTR